MKTTVAIQIGNSDDKLHQIEWSAFIHKTSSLIHNRADKIFFTGFSVPTEVWQNACWIFLIDASQSHLLWDEMKNLCREFKQDSIAWMEGITVFVEA